MKGNNKRHSILAGVPRLRTILSVLVLTVLGGNSIVKAETLNVSIVDKIKTGSSDTNKGKLVAIASESGAYTFEWYRSTDGSSWDKIIRRNVATLFGHDYYNVSETGDWLDPSMDRLASGVTDDSKRLIYKVKIATRDGGSVGPVTISEPYGIPYYSALMNGDFENLLLSGNLYPYPWSGNADASNPGGKYWVSSDLSDEQIDANTKPVYGSYFVYERHEEELIWKTTDKYGCLEIINASPNKTVNANTSASYNKGTYRDFVVNNLFAGITTGEGNGATLSGEQMAEVNSESIATLYQDILTIPGNELKWDIWHRARAVSGVDHIDQMRVLIMDSALAEKLTAKYPNDPQEAVLYIINHSDEFPGAFVSEKLSADVYNWTEHVGTYIVPEKQNLTRLFFVSESGNPGMGNFLDGITFSNSKPHPQPHEAVINIQKTISGEITDEQASALKNNIEFSVKVGTETQTIKGIDLFWQSTLDGEWVGTWSGRYIVEAGEDVPYSVKESLSSSDVPPFKLEYTDSGNTRGFLTDGLISNVSFSNHYIFDKIVIRKSGLKAGESATFSVVRTDDSSIRFNVLLTGTGSDPVSATITNLDPGEYTVIETDWSWAYNETPLAPITKTITVEDHTFEFTNMPKDSSPLHSEAMKGNSVVGYEDGGIVVDVTDWEKADSRKIEL